MFQYARPRSEFPEKPVGEDMDQIMENTRENTASNIPRDIGRNIPRDIGRKIHRISTVFHIEED